MHNKSTVITDGFMDHITYIDHVCEIINDLKIEFPEFKDLTEELKNTLSKLVAAVYNNSEQVSVDKHLISYFKIESKYIPIIIKNIDGNIKIFNAVTMYNNTFAVQEAEHFYKVPNFFFFPLDILKNLYSYDIKALENQIVDVDYDSNNLLSLNNSVLMLISIFDSNNDIEVLKLAEIMTKRILDIANEDIYYFNLLQIIKRYRFLTDGERSTLKKWENETDNLLFLCGIYTLLDKKEHAKEIFVKIGDNPKKEFMQFPIYNLYKKIIE